jgi:hypothetical protein
MFQRKFSCYFAASPPTHQDFMQGPPLITREQFGGSASEDASMHLHNFCEICDMQKFKYVEKYCQAKIIPILS